MILRCSEHRVHQVLLCMMLCGCTLIRVPLLTWGGADTRMHYGKKTSRQRQGDACCAMLCWETLDPGSHVDITLARCSRTCMPLHGNGIPWHLSAEYYKYSLRTTTTSLWCWPSLQIPLISICFSIGWTNMPDPWRPHRACLNVQRSCRVHVSMSQSSTVGSYTVSGQRI